MLFGHQNDSSKQGDSVINDVTAPAAPGANPLAADPVTGVSLPVPPEELDQDDTTEASVLNQNQSEATTPEVPAPAEPATAPTADTPSSDATVPSTTAPSASDDLLQPSGSDDLLTLKQQALEQLSPLVNHLEQTPEEKFRTTMMMIQSSDNQALIKDAYEAAQQITDDKARAQALLDIVNEINYFTQNADADTK